jgi:hypothetical protein
MTSTAAYVLPETADIDILSQPATTTLKASSLRPGHVLVDDLGCPAAVIDHRVRAQRGTGAVAYLTNDLDRGGWRTVTFGPNSRITVMAR